MNLTVEQKQTLKTWLEANAVGLNDEDAANLLNTLATPAYKVYRTSVPMSEIMLNGFDWTRVDNLSVGKARIWEWMFDADPRTRSIEPSKSNVRAGINAVWVGTQADLNVRAAVYLHCFRDATVGEKLFATGSGVVADANGSGPSTLGVGSDGLPIQGLFDANDVSEARTL